MYITVNLKITYFMERVKFVTSMMRQHKINSKTASGMWAASRKVNFMVRANYF